MAGHSACRKEATFEWKESFEDERTSMVVASRSTTIAGEWKLCGLGSVHILRKLKEGGEGVWAGGYLI